MSKINIFCGKSRKFVTFVENNIKFDSYVERWLNSPEHGLQQCRSASSSTPMASYRLEEWMKKEWPDWNPMERDCDEFGGTLDCPVCGQSYLTIGYHDKPFCFHCNTDVDAADCEDCGRTYLVSEGCCSPDD